MGGGRRGCWLLRLFEVSGQGTQETKVTKHSRRKSATKGNIGEIMEEKRKMYGILKDKIKDTKNNKVY